MKEFLLKILEGLFNAFTEIIDELIGFNKKKYKKAERSTSTSQPPVPSSPAEPKPLVNIPVPVEMEIGSDEPPQYKKTKSVLTFQERKLLGSIRKAIGDEYIVLMKVRMGDFIYLANEPKEKKSHTNQVICKHVDFLLCGKMRVEPLLVIELDDVSHKYPDHLERDKFKNDTFDAVGLPYLRIELQKSYDANILRSQIKERILEEAPLFGTNSDPTSPS